MAECGSVEQALAFFGRYNLPGAHEDHFLFIDQSGASAVVEWKDGRQVVLRKEGAFQVITNFALSDHKLGWYPCPRYDKATKMLQEGGLSMKSMAAILKATAQSWDGGGTYYSNVYDLNNLTIQVYYKADFSRAVTLKLQDELAKGPRTIRIEDLFGR